MSNTDFLSRIASTAAPKQMAHPTDPPLLRCNDRIKNRPKLRTYIVLKGIFRHFHGASVMRYHLPHKITIHLICGPCTAHITKHPLHDLIHPALILAQFLSRVSVFAALALNSLHVFNTFCLLRYNSEGNLL